jgi:AAA15 family ATPase/GTPase
MGNLFIKKLSIKNLKCFEEAIVDFNVPDGENEGSGLNILIGENGTGKTTILEAVNNVTQTAFSISNRVDVSDFRDIKNDVSIIIDTEEFNCKMPYPDNYFESNGIELNIKSRERKSPGKLLSQPFQIKTHFKNVNTRYRNSKGEFTNQLLDFHRIFNTDNIKDDEFSTFFFDKNRTRHLQTGTFKTTFDKICEDLNWKFIKNITNENKEQYLASADGEYFTKVRDIANTSAGAILAEDLKVFFDDARYQDLKIDFLDLLTPFKNSFFALRSEGELNQIKPKDLGSGVEMILSILLLRSIAGESKGTLIYLIDEPELNLHPRAQDKLFNLLLEESKTKQIIISTHSPYLFKNSLGKNVGLHIFTRNDSNGIVIENATSRSWGKLPWSPSWGEINYYAYNTPTIELHNELYGYIQDYHERYNINVMDDYLVEKGILRDKAWIKIRGGNPQPPESVTLCTYIRNAIHHPENTLNGEYSLEDLKASIEFLYSIIDSA